MCVVGVWQHILIERGRGGDIRFINDIEKTGLGLKNTKITK